MNFLSTVKSVGKKALTKVKADSPQILLVVGGAMVLTGTVLACVKTANEFNDVKEELDEEKENLEQEIVDENLNRGKELTKFYFKAAKTYVKLYFVDGMLIIGGLGAIGGGFGILNKKYTDSVTWGTNMAAAYSSLRKKIREKYGEEVEYALVNGEETHTEVVETVDENGNVKTEVKETKYRNPVTNPYAFLFEEATSDAYRIDGLSHTPDSYWNWMFITQVEDQCNKMLERDGYIFLNDVLKMLGIARVYPYGNEVGWIKESGYRVSFGISDVNSQRIRDFREGYEPGLLLDMNPEGYILDKLQKKIRFSGFNRR